MTREWLDDWSPFGVSEAQALKWHNGRSVFFVQWSSSSSDSPPLDRSATLLDDITITLSRDYTHVRVADGPEHGGRFPDQQLQVGEGAMYSNRGGVFWHWTPVGNRTTLIAQAPEPVQRPWWRRRR